MKTKYKYIEDYLKEIIRVANVVESTKDWKLKQDQTRYLKKLEKEMTYLKYAKKNNNR